MKTASTTIAAIILLAGSASAQPYQNNDALGGPTPPPAGTLVGISVEGSLFTIDTTTGAGTQYGTIPGIEGGGGVGYNEIEYDASSGRAWAQERNGNFQAQEFDIATGSGINAPIFNGASYHAMEFIDGVLYAAGFAGDDIDGPSNGLVILDPTSGTETFIGSGFASAQMTGIAYDGSTLYGVTGGGDADLYTIDLVTGAETLVGSTFLRLGSLEFGADGVLYAGGTGSDGAAGNLYSIDTSTGAPTLIGATGFGNPGNGISGLALIGDIPTTTLTGTAYIVHGGLNAGATAGGELATVDLATGVITSLGLPTGTGLTGVAVANGSLYASTADGNLANIAFDGTFISQDAFSGAGYDQVLGDRFNDLTADTNGNLFGTARIAAVDQLVSVTPAGVITVLGPNLTTDGGFGAVTIDANGDLLVGATNFSAIDRYDSTTGALIGTVRGDDGTGIGALGLGFDPVSGSLVLSECCNGTVGDLGEALFAVDSHGDTALLFDFDDGRRIQDIVFAPLPETTAFIAEWENPAGATATATFNVDIENLNAIYNGGIEGGGGGDPFSDGTISNFAINLAGSPTGNGAWTQSDFLNATLGFAVPIDPTIEWVGQAQVTNNWGDGQFQTGFNGDHDFNIFAGTPEAPNGTFFYELSPSGAFRGGGGSSNALFLTSFAPGVPTIWWTSTNTNEIWTASSDGAGTPSMLYANATEGSTGPVGIDYDQADRTLYWSGGNNFSFWSGDPDASEAPTFLYSTLESEALDVSFDGVDDRVFIVDNDGGIEVASPAAGSTVSLVYDTNDNTTVFYNAPNDTLYWAGSTSGPLRGKGKGLTQIFAGNPDGSSFSTLYTASGVRDIQVLDDTIYWVDNSSLWSAPADGSGAPAVLVDPNNGNLRALDIYNNRIYLGEFTSNSPTSIDTISVCDLDGSNLEVLYQGQFGSLRGLAVGTNPAKLRLCADVNDDGDVTPADFTAWLAAFNTMSPVCDVNGDRVCDPADFTAWLGAFNLGLEGPRCFP